MQKNKPKLWQTSSNLDKEVENYTIWEDYLLDKKLIPYDLIWSKAHAKMLKKMWVLTEKELESLLKWFKEIQLLWEKWEFEISLEQEDWHTAIEQFLTENCWEAWKKIHTWRSRNDQILTVMRLFMKDEVLDLENLLKNLISSIEEKWDEFWEQIFPWYTHMQRAMPTTAKIWITSFSDALKDSLFKIEWLKKLLNQSPLWSASGFWIRNFKMDRNFTAKEMWFWKVQENPLYCGLSRGFFEWQFLETFSSVIFILWRFSNDLLLFTSKEFDFFQLPNSMTTGSSIMPQKRNYDLFEILRWNVSVYFSLENQIKDIIKPMMCGYNRDLQLTKKPFLEWLKLLKSTISISKKAITNLEIKKESIEKTLSEEIFLTEKVYDLLKKWISFREAYQIVKGEYFREK